MVSAAVHHPKHKWIPFGDSDNVRHLPPNHLHNTSSDASNVLREHVVVVPCPPNCTLFSRLHAVPAHTVSSPKMCCSSALPMMFAIWIGRSAISMPFVIGDDTGEDPVLSMVVGCSCLAVQCGIRAMALCHCRRCARRIGQSIERSSRPISIQSTVSTHS